MKAHETPDLGPNSLGGDKGANKTYFWRSRSGNMCILDDLEGTIRIEEKTGKSVIQLEKEYIRIMQKSGDGIFIHAKEKIRLDCKNFEVHASNKIFMHAKQDWGLKAENGHISLEAGMKLNGTAKGSKAANHAGDGVGIVFNSDKDLDFQAGTTLDLTAGQNMLLKSSSADMKVKAGLKLSMTAPKDLNVSSKAKISTSALMGITMGTKGEMKLDAGGNIFCKSMCININ